MEVLKKSEWIGKEYDPEIAKLASGLQPTCNNDEVISRQLAVDTLRQRAESLRGVIGDIGGACSGAAKLMAALPPAKPPWTPQEYPKRGAWYQHFKGGTYKVLNINVLHTETQEPLVVYLDLAGQIWARPESEFYGLVETEDGTKVPRFVLIGEE